MAKPRYKTRFSITNLHSVIEAVHTFQEWLKEWTTWLITQVMLVAMYFLGIGVSALGKRLVSLWSKTAIWSQGWQKYFDSEKLEKMY